LQNPKANGTVSVREELGLRLLALEALPRNGIPDEDVDSACDQRQPANRNDFEPRDDRQLNPVPIDAVAEAQSKGQE
jgi:hypothetical protein